MGLMTRVRVWIGTGFLVAALLVYPTKVRKRMMNCLDFL